MRLQLIVAVLCAATLAFGDVEGEVTARTAYYKEYSTRVIQPMVDLTLQSENFAADGHLLLDAITSASAASGAVNSTPFTENRFEAGLGISNQLFDNTTVGAAVRASTEPDYRSSFLSLNWKQEFAQKNSTLDTRFTFGHDSLDNSGSQGGISSTIEGTVNTTIGSLSFSQLLSPTLIASGGYELSYVTGFLQNPYRTVIAAGMFQQERVPDARLRNAPNVGLRWYIPSSQSAFVLNYRYYFDDWGIRAHTPEVRWIQEYAPTLFLTFRTRFHTQTAADFYKDIYNTADPEMEPYLTSDEKLSTYWTLTVGTKLEIGLDVIGFTGFLGSMTAIAVGEYVVQRNHYGDAVIVQTALRIPIGQ